MLTAANMGYTLLKSDNEADIQTELEPASQSHWILNQIISHLSWAFLKIVSIQVLAMLLVFVAGGFRRLFLKCFIVFAQSCLLRIALGP